MARGMILLIGALLAVPAGASAQTTELFLDSQPGDFVGGGIKQTFTVLDGNFTANHNFVNNGVSINFNAPSFTHFWNLDFAAADNAPLVPGVYEGAVRFPFQGPGQPGLSVAGDGRGCNMVTGRFEVLEATYGATGNVVSFAATFEQHCEGMPPALFGRILFNANAPVPPVITLTLTGCTDCHLGDRFAVQGHITNPGTAAITVEFKLGLRLPGGTGISLLGENSQHLVLTLPPRLDSVFQVANFRWPASATTGVWQVECTLLEPSLGKTYSRDVKAFELAP
jgi:hypothetical protein